MELEFSGDLWYWRGPAPWYFVTVPEDQSADIAENASSVTYGWGMIPGTVRIGRTEFTTSLFCKDDGYVVPVKAAVRKAERLELGDVVQMRLTIAM